MTSEPNNRDKVEEIKNALDIVDVIGKTVSLHRESNGSYAGATSPTSKSGASLKVDKSKQCWHNFATGEKGDVFDWIGCINRLDARGTGFPEVLRIAADLAGVELADMTDGERDSAKEKADIQNIFTDAAGAYHGNLTPEHYDYIKEKWGISRETVDRLKIGYATTGRDLKDLDVTTLKKSGLVYVNGGMLGGEVFTGRIIFPYWKNGKAVYLIGRQTPETPFKKDGSEPSKYQKLLVHSDKFPYVSRSVQNSYFYGEDSLRGSDYCIITEGVADCIVMSQAGFPCISPVTTRFKEKDHPKLLSLTRGLKRVYICNDNETNQAGLKGALSTAEALEGAGIETRLIELPKPEDLDKIDIADYMKGNSPEDFKELMDSSIGLCDYKLEQQVIPTSSTSTERLRAFKAFISNHLCFMPDDEWEVFVKNEVVKKYRLKKLEINGAVAAAAKERQNAGEEENAPDEKSEGEGRSKEYPEWAITKANDLLDDGDPFDFILKTWQKRHVGDTNIGENCLCSVVTRNILNSKRGLHIKPSGESGKGKSDAIECFLELLPIGVYITGSMSAKALFYDKNLPPGTIIYSDDASFTEDVISTIKQSTSQFQKTTIHRTVSNGESQTFAIPERVTFWFSAVEGMDDEQLANRFLHAEVDNSRDQDMRVHQHQKDTECWYESDNVEPDVIICRCIFDILFKEFYRVKIPFVELITWNNIENRRNFDKFKDVIRAVTVYNCRKREIFDGFILATADDFERALKIYKGTSVNNATNLTDTELKYLRYIVNAPNKTVTQRMLVDHFKVSDTAVRNMLNGKKNNGGLLAKVKQLIPLDKTDTVKLENGSTSTKAKLYQYTGEFTGLDLYESIAELNYEAVDNITNEFKSKLHENMLRVTMGNHEGNLNMVTLKNDCDIHNNILNNNNITMSEKKTDGFFSSSPVCANVSNDDEKIEGNFQVTASPEKVGYVNGKMSQTASETGVTSVGYSGSHMVRDRVKSTQETGAVDIHNQGYPYEGNEKDNSIAELLRKALKKYAWDEYNGTVESIQVMVGKFNERNPEYKQRLGSDAVLSNAERLSSRGWK